MLCHSLDYRVAGNLIAENHRCPTAWRTLREQAIVFFVLVSCLQYVEKNLTPDCGQVSINISKPGITKGQHWHNSKWEQFIVVSGHGLIQERNINTGEKIEFEVRGDNIEAI